MKEKRIISRPTIFIASSGKSKRIAEAVKLNFDSEADVDIWTENVFKLNESALEVLLNRANYYDFFIAIFANDDKKEQDKKNISVVRDNVIFEFGLFLGRIGLDRTFFILEEGVSLLTDLSGITYTTFTRRSNLVSALGTSCIKIREKMQVAGDLFTFTQLPSTALAVGYYNNFLKPVLDALTNQKSIEIILERDRYGNVLKKIDHVLKAPYPTIEIRVPHNLALLQRDILNRKTSGYKQILLNALSRPFPFYLKGIIDKNKRINLFDIPTTLYASYLTIKEVFSPSFLASENNLQKLIDKEIKNFQTTLSKLIPDGIESKFYRFIVY